MSGIKANLGLHNSMERLEQKRQQMNLYVIIIGIAFIGFFCIMMFPESAMTQVIFYAIIIAIIFSGIQITRVNKEYKAIYKDIFVEEPIVKNFDNAIYLPTKGFISADVSSFNLVKMGNRFSSEDYIKASYMGVPFEVSDVTVQYHTSGKNSHTTTYFRGRMMIFDFPERIANSVRIYSNTFKYRAGEGFFGKMHNADKIELESIDFNRMFDVYSASDFDTYYLLTPLFMERLMKLAAKYKSVALNAYGNRIVIGFNELNNAFDAKNMFEKISYPEEMAKIQDDIDDIKDIISTIRNIQETSGSNHGPLAPDITPQAQADRRIQFGNQMQQPQQPQQPLVDPAAMGAPGMRSDGDVMGLLRNHKF